MEIEETFAVKAAPDRVFAYLLDVNRVAGCMPGAELAEVIDPQTFEGRVKIKVGPITTAYKGTARITSRDDSTRTATLTAEGRETTGPGGARATATMHVEATDGGSSVTLTTEFTVAGRVAQFGRGIMEDVSRRLVAQMADCIRGNLEAPEPETGAAGAAGLEGAAGTPAAVPAQAAPVNALGLFFAVVWDWVRGLFGGRRVAGKKV